MTWEEKQGEITIKHGGSAAGCAKVPFTVIGLGIITLGVLMYLEIVVLPFDGDHLPLMIFTALFGLFWCFATLSSQQGSAESIVVIDTFNKIIRFRGHKEDSEVIIPFFHLQALIIHETVIEKSTYRSVGVRGPETSFPTKTYSYRLYFHKTDGSIFWLYTFAAKQEALEHVQLLLNHIEISCIDEANGGLSRTTPNPYTEPSSVTAPAKCSPFYNAEKNSAGETEVTVRYERMTFNRFIRAMFFLSLFIGCPLWFYVVNISLLSGAFLIIPSVAVFFYLVATFFRGRKYALVCRPAIMEMRVKFNFPIFQLIFGKSARLPATALQAVRVSRYDGGDLHLEIAVSKSVSLPRLTRAAFNSGSVRMLPRSITSDDTHHLGVWAITPLAKKGAGPTMADLYAAEALIQSAYHMDSTIA